MLCFRGTIYGFFLCSLNLENLVFFSSVGVHANLVLRLTRQAIFDSFFSGPLMVTWLSSSPLLHCSATKNYENNNPSLSIINKIDEMTLHLFLQKKTTSG